MKTYGFRAFRARGGSVALLLIAVLGSATVRASGGLAGNVRNANTGQYLEGAEVTLVERNTSILTVRDGTFQFLGLPAGTYTLRVTYTGLDVQSQAVEVTERGIVALPIALTSAVYNLDPFVVAGVREGNAASITQQRNADGVMNVVAMDAFGNVADGNVGNFLQRLPGVGAILELGDVVGIGVRGTPPGMNAFTIDGTTTAAASSTIYAGATGSDRAVPVDQIPSDFIKEVQLIKAPTPDIPANSIGGTANMITKSALDVKGTQFSYRLGGNLNTFRREQRTWTPTGSFTYLTKLGRNENVGLAWSGSYAETQNGRDRVQMARSQTQNYTTQARTLNDWATRLRAASNVKFNFRPLDTVDLSFGVAYTYYSFQQPRYDWNFTSVSRVADYSRVSRSQIEAGTVPRDTTNQTAGTAPGSSPYFTEMLNASFQNIGSGSARHSRTYKFTGDADIRLKAEQSLSLKAAFSPSKFSTRFQTLNATRLAAAPGVGIAVDSSRDIFRPIYRQTFGPNLGVGTDFSQFTATRTISANDNEDRVVNLKADYGKHFTNGETKFQLKSGLLFQEQKRKEAPYSPVWNYVGPDGVAGRNPSTGLNDDNIAQWVQRAPGYGLFNNLFPQRDALDFPAFMTYFNEHPGQFRESGTTVSQGPQHREMTEDVSAAYVMGTAYVHGLRLVGGVRAEESDIHAIGQNRDPRNPTDTLRTRDGNYRNYFPSLHLRYTATKDVVLRASYSTGAARADFADLYPNTTVSYNQNTGLGTVNSATPELKPAYSRNYDLSAEWYAGPAGVISGSGFYKKISNFLATETTTIGNGSSNGFGGLYEGFDLITTANAGDATVKGYELNFMHQFVWLPQPFNTLTLNANYTRTKTKGAYANGAGELIAFIPRMANVGLSGRYKKIEARVSYNLKGGYLRAYNANPDLRSHTTSVGTWDFNVQYQFHRRLTVFVDLVNAFNQWESWYTGSDRLRVTMAEVYGTRLNVGLSGRF